MRNLVRAGTMAAAVVLAGSIFVTAQEPRPQPPAGGRGGQPSGLQQPRVNAGANDKPGVDPVAAAEGKKLWALECINCHGASARGGDGGPNLVRSLVVLRDRFGSTLGPFLKKGHKMQSGRSSTELSDDQVLMLAHFLRDRVNVTLRGSSEFEVQNILTGDAKAGEAYFNGDGKCSTCHSATGDLRGLGGKYEPVDIQQRFLFPRNATPGAGGGRGRGRAGAGAAPSPTTAITVTVTPKNGEPVSGVLLQMDDFNVSLRDGSGWYRTFARTPDLKVTKTDPLAAHRALLENLTDKNMHDVVAYLETLK
jgi:cytochrome c oxidase cbb3-type subunit III